MCVIVVVLVDRYLVLHPNNQPNKDASSLTVLFSPSTQYTSKKISPYSLNNLNATVWVCHNIIIFTVRSNDLYCHKIRSWCLRFLGTLSEAVMIISFVRISHFNCMTIKLVTLIPLSMGLVIYVRKSWKKHTLYRYWQNYSINYGCRTTKT